MRISITLTVVVAALGACLPPGVTKSQIIAQSDNSELPIPMGTTEGLRPDRLIIRGGVMVSGRGTPGTGRAAPPEGPVDIVVENGRIADIIPIDPVSVASGLSEQEKESKR